MKSFFAILSLTLILGGCSTRPEVKFVNSTFTQSPELKSCADAPLKPKSNYTQRDVAKYIKKQQFAHADCKEDLQALNKEISGYNDAVKKKPKR
jgi:uncharacterized lipoprotein YajG